jgi:hypothetical protein
MVDEITNMLGYRVGTYIQAYNIPKEHRKNTLCSLMFITPHDDVYYKTKARLVGDGSRQHNHPYDIISSSQASLIAAMLVLNIASYYTANHELFIFTLRGTWQ